MSDKISDLEKTSGFNEYLTDLINGGDSACPPEPPLRFAMMRVLPFRELPVCIFHDAGTAVMAELNRLIPTPQRGLKFGSGETLHSRKKNSNRKI
jgi:hypothetical protein